MDLKFTINSWWIFIINSYKKWALPPATSSFSTMESHHDLRTKYLRVLNLKRLCHLYFVHPWCWSTRMDHMYRSLIAHLRPLALYTAMGDSRVNALCNTEDGRHNVRALSEVQWCVSSLWVHLSWRTHSQPATSKWTCICAPQTSPYPSEQHHRQHVRWAFCWRHLYHDLSLNRPSNGCFRTNKLLT